MRTTEKSLYVSLFSLKNSVVLDLKLCGSLCNLIPAKRNNNLTTKYKMEINEITRTIIGCGIEVHKQLGPGLLESAYEECLVFELKQKGLRVERQKALPIQYKDIQLEYGYRIDLLVENTVVIELKSVDILHPLHEAQILTYMKFAEKKVGLLMNFNVLVLKDGVKRFMR
jgi:GxxExxY protein